MLRDRWLDSLSSTIQKFLNHPLYLWSDLSGCIMGWNWAYALSLRTIGRAIVGRYNTTSETCLGQWLVFLWVLPLFETCQGVRLLQKGAKKAHNWTFSSKLQLRSSSDPAWCHGSLDILWQGTNPKKNLLGPIPRPRLLWNIVPLETKYKQSGYQSVELVWVSQGGPSGCHRGNDEP